MTAVLVTSAALALAALLALSLDAHGHGLTGPTTTSSAPSTTTPSTTPTSTTDRPTTTAAPTTTLRPTTTTTTTTPAPSPPYPGVGATSVNAVDRSAWPTSPRQVPTTVWYPTTKTGAVDKSGAPYPLIMFSEGYQQNPANYLTLISAWVDAGFVVAGPNYPYTSSTDPTATRADLVNHPADLAAALSAVVAASNSSGSPLSGLVNAGEVGLAGQSDGGNTTLAAIADTCCKLKETIRGVAVLSGSEYKLFGGTWFTSANPPLLVVQGTTDNLNPPGCSANTYNDAHTPKYYLDLLGATHILPYQTSGSPYEPVVAAVTTDFFTATLSGQGSARTAMAKAGTRSQLSSFQSGGTAPPATPSCPTLTTNPTGTPSTGAATATAAASTQALVSGSGDRRARA
jgi:hypothetical protein